MKEKLKNKKVIISVIAIILVITIICGGYFLALHLMKSSALKEVNNVFSAIKSGDEETLNRYLGEENSSEKESKEENQESKEMQKVMLSNMNYEIISSDVNFKECVVKLNISNKDLEKVFTNYMQKAFSLAFSQAFGQMTEEDMNTQMEEYFKAQYNSEGVETITNEITVTMTRKDGKWNMNADKDQVLNAILPGYKSIIESFNNIQ